MILRPKHGPWVLYPGDRASEREFFDTETENREFAAQHYRHIEVIIPQNQNYSAHPAVAIPRPQDAAGLTLGYYFVYRDTKA